MAKKSNRLLLSRRLVLPLVHLLCGLFERAASFHVRHSLLGVQHAICAAGLLALAGCKGVQTGAAVRVRGRPCVPVYMPPSLFRGYTRYKMSVTYHCVDVVCL